MNALIMTCLAVISGSAPARAWGTKGHEAVAMIADDRLSANAKAKVQELLGPNFTLDAVANCADWIRDRGGPVQCAAFSVDSDSSTGHWHVLPIPLASTPTLSSVDGSCGGGCLISAIESHMRILADARAPRFERQKALLYVVHFAADLHQPLHCALDDAPVEMTKRFGNTRTIVWKGKSQKLHHFWDELLLTDAEEKKVDTRTLVKTLERDLAAKDTAAWVQGDFLREAALESFDIARGTIYPRTQRSQGRLSAEERQEMLAIVNERLERAGVRLAAWLEQALH
jgi:hypothetical protein